MKNQRTPPARAKTGHHSRQTNIGATKIKDREIHQTRGTQAEGIPTPSEVNSVQQPQKMLPSPEPPPAATQTALTKPSGQRPPPVRAETIPHSEAENIKKNINSDNLKYSRGNVATGTAVATRHSSQKQIRAAKQRKSAAAAEEVNSTGMNETSEGRANTGNTETTPPALSRFWGNTTGIPAEQPHAWSMAKPASRVASAKDGAQCVKDGTAGGNRDQLGAGSVEGGLSGPLMTSTGDRRQGDHKAAGESWRASDKIRRVTGGGCGRQLPRGIENRRPHPARGSRSPHREWHSDPGPRSGREG